MALKAVVLPAPLGPISESTSPLAHLEGDVVDGGEAAEADRQPFDRELGGGARAHGAASAVGRPAGAAMAALARPCHQRRTAGTIPSGRK